MDLDTHYHVWAHVFVNMFVSVVVGVVTPVENFPMLTGILKGHYFVYTCIYSEHCVKRLIITKSRFWIKYNLSIKVNEKFVIFYAKLFYNLELQAHSLNVKITLGLQYNSDVLGQRQYSKAWYAVRNKWPIAWYLDLQIKINYV